MTTRAVTIPVFQDPLGNIQGVYVRFALVDLYGRPITGYTAANAIVTGERIAADPAAPVTVNLIPNAEITPASRWRVTIEHTDIPTPAKDCTLLAGAGAIDLHVLMESGAPADPWNHWAKYLLPPYDATKIGWFITAADDGNGGSTPVWVQVPPGSGDMSTLIYDPRGIADDGFDLQHLTGNLDCGQF